MDNANAALIKEMENGNNQSQTEHLNQEGKGNKQLNSCKWYGPSGS